MEFLSIWQDSLPKIDNENEELFKVDLNQLEGLSLGKKHNKSKLVGVLYQI